MNFYDLSILTNYQHISPMTPSPALHIMVVEDNDSLREATVDFLVQQGHQVMGVVCAEDVDDTPTRDLPDLYLIDINLPGEDGFSLATRIRKSQPQTGIVLLTARSHLSDRLTGWDCGADNYLTKPVEQAELLACVNNLGRRLKTTTSAPQSTLLLDRQTLSLTGPQGRVPLTFAETQLLAALCRAAGQKLERWQAMQLVDNKDKGLLPANLEMRISALRKKLTTCGAPKDAILTLRNFGYSLSCDIQLT
jgi:DNA-binding response OmpR family regulator